MLYIYDILVNFIDGDRIYEFFEWNYKDVVEHIKRMPVIRVNNQVFTDLVFNEVKVNKDLLTLLYNKSCTYNEPIEYACIISNLERCYALEFNSNGDVLFKSSLLIDEEEEIVECSKKLPEFKIDYEVIKKINKHDFIYTRKEEIDINLLKRDITNTYNNKNYEKLDYLYNEAYGEDKLSIDDKYNKLLRDINNNFSGNLKKLIHIINLSYKKKKTI